LESIAATDFNFGAMIFTSSCSCPEKFCALPSSAVLCLNLAVRCSVQEAYSSFLRWIWEVEGLNCLQSLGLLWPWNGDRLKNS